LAEAEAELEGAYSRVHEGMKDSAHDLIKERELNRAELDSRAHRYPGTEEARECAARASAIAECIADLRAVWFPRRSL